MDSIFKPQSKFLAEPTPTLCATELSLKFDPIVIVIIWPSHQKLGRPGDASIFLPVKTFDHIKTFCSATPYNDASNSQYNKENSLMSHENYEGFMIYVRLVVDLLENET